MKLDQKYFQYLMKQNVGHFWKSIFHQISLTNYWFYDWEIVVGLLNCIFQLKSKTREHLDMPKKWAKVVWFLFVFVKEVFITAAAVC